MLIRIIKIAFLFIVASISTITAQQLALKNYTVEDGLSQSSVYSILQDNDGYMWFGTEGGISKFDGVNFTNFLTEDGLPDNWVYCMIQDDNGILWFGTYNGGVVKYDGKKFTTFSKSNGLISNTIYSILQDKNGNLWFGTEAGLCKYDGKKFTSFTTKNGLKESLVRNIINDSKGNLWLCYGSLGGGITKYNGKDFINYSAKDGLSCDQVYSLYEDDKSNLWIGTEKGICKLENDRIVTFSDKLISSFTVTSICQDKYKTFWFGTYDNGILEYKNGKFLNFTKQNGLSSNQVKAIYEDKRGDLWFGMNNGGVIKYSAERFLSYTLKDGLHNDNIYAINEYPEGAIWLGTSGGGIVKIDNGKLSSFSEKDGLSDSFISSIFVANDNVVWVGTRFAGIFKYENNRFTNFNTKQGLIDNFVFSIYQDENSNLWFATDAGISKFDGNKFQNFSEKEGLVNNSVYSILEDIKGNLWFGTAGGLSRYDGRKFYNYTIKDGLIDNTIFTLAEDKTGNIWIGTQGGVSVFDGAKFKNITTKDGLSHNICNYFIIDKGYIYIGTNKGIDRLDLNSFRKNIINIKLFTAKDGLPASECTQGGVFKDSEGNLWFGTIKGVTKYNSQNSPNVLSPPVFITAMKVMDKPVSLDNDISLKYTQNYVRFEFMSLSFASPEKLVYRYILEGVDNNWHETGDRAVTYSSLKPGDYTFKIFAKNEDGNWSSKPAIKHFSITPPFYETFWFRSLMIILAITSVYSIYIIKTRQVKKRNQELALMVKDRTRELEQEKNKSEELLHNILPGSLVEELKNKGYVLPREFKNVSILFTDFKGFTYIAAVLPADKLVNELNEMFKNFDHIIEKYGLEKLKTIGDSYMVGAGLPKEADDHAIRIILAGLEMQKYIVERNQTSAIKWDMRAGVHSGHVIAGVVGTKKFTYDIWGDTVNIASRMESAGAPGEINISAYTYMLVRDYFDCEYRGKVTAKGKGELDMYFVKGITKNIPMNAAVQSNT